MKKYTDEQLLQFLRDYIQEFHKTPTSTAFNKLPNYPSGSLYTIRFGSFMKALELVGIDPDISQVRTLTKTNISLMCDCCKKQFTRRSSEHNHPSRSKTAKTFCSRSCSRSYNNTHKTSGFRRSKLEHFFEHNIQQDFPMLQFTFNDNTTIGSELDIVCHSLRIAIELNGIVHYEPIYGADKFERIVHNDRQKQMRCNDIGYELIVVNAANQSRVTSSTCRALYEPVKAIIRSLLTRS